MEKMVLRDEMKMSMRLTHQRKERELCFAMGAPIPNLQTLSVVLLYGPLNQSTLP